MLMVRPVFHFDHVYRTRTSLYCSAQCELNGRKKTLGQKQFLMDIDKL
jgi:hypothetical protein